MSNEVGAVRGETGGDPTAPLLSRPFIYRSACIQPLQTGSGATARSSHQPPAPREALDDRKTTVCTEGTKFSFEFYLSSTIS